VERADQNPLLPSGRVGEANNYYFGDHDIWRLPQADDTYMGTNPRYTYVRRPARRASAGS